MAKHVNELRSGAVLSYVNLGLSSLIPFFYTPIMLRLLGSAEYGLYSLSSSVIGYFSLLSFGFGSAIIRYITIYRTSGEKEKERKIFGFFLMLYCGIAIIIILLGLVLAGNVEQIFQKGLSENEIGKMKILLLIMSFNTALSFPISVFSSVVMAHEKYVFRRLVDMLSTVAAPICNLIALYVGFRSVGMAVVSTIIQFIMLPLNVFYCIKGLEVSPKFAMIPKELVKEITGFSFFVFIGSIVDMLFWSTDKVILGMLTGTTAVAVYNIGGTFNSMITNLSASLSGVLTPRITTMVVTGGSNEELTDIFTRVGRIQYLVVALVVSGFTVFGKSFIELWAGRSYANAYWIAILTMFPLCVPLIQNTGLSIITAQNRHRFRSVVYLVIAIVNVIATYMVVPYWGEVGAAVCSGISYILGQGIIMNIYYHKAIGINIPWFWKNIIQMSWVPAIMLILGLTTVSYVEINSWFCFFVGVILFSACYAVFMMRFTMNSYEKDIVFGVVNKLLPVKKK